MQRAFVLCALSAAASAAPHNGAALLQTWEKSLDSGKDTPITRVVNLLKEMQQTLGKDMEEDENLFKELECWCNTGKYDKEEATKASTAKIEQLTSDIESMTAKSSELDTNIKELMSQSASDKQALAEATALREKQQSEFQGMENDNVQALENLKAAIEMLSKHQEAPPDSTVAGGAVFKSERDSWSLLQSSIKDTPWSDAHEEAAAPTVAGGAVFKSERDSWSLLQSSIKDTPWSDAHEESRGARTLENFMRRNGFDDVNAVDDSASMKPIAPHKFLQASSTGKASSWSAEDSALVKRAMKSVAAFVQSHHSAAYFPAYTSQSGEIFSVLKQLEEEMGGDLSEAQKIEQARGAAFSELRAAKSTQIKEGEAMEEQKEDEKANTDNALAEAKEDLEQEQKVLGEDSVFLKNLNEMCAKGDADFQERKQARLTEIQAVAETIEILMGDEARDAMSGTYNSFVQVAAARQNTRRHQAAQLLRKAARQSNNPALLVLASSAELDAFTKVKAAIDEMVVMLKQQQEDEVKKNDWCKSEIHTNEMTTAKTEDTKADLEAKINELTSTITTLESEIADAYAQIEQTQLDLQRATEDRKAANFDFQKTVSDQTITIEVLKKALDRLATFYDFLQKKGGASFVQNKQTPPVPQKEYSKNKGSTGVMEMIEKLIHEAADLRKDSQEAEGSAQAAYEQLIADTNGSVEALQKEITSKLAAKADAEKDKLSAESDLSDTNKELEGLSKYSSELHSECDYLLKNFDLRQSKRAEEVEALQQAKQILDGAS
eukprot:CAMPEP_0183484958 /NCGR_PEP_ID=MMETSP0370-20130417/179184_1 /TAXON_ID=268820 /ORGANISM="Peridinium aciculiferum, Strain PAER-2" /LENGTH=777 /DNA_ID=CAMNT_0025678253 /DNA_START=73 /DNA_END=2404 /DNA_ORIENTATION=+